MQTPESLLAILGRMPEKTPLALQILETQVYDAYIRQLVEYTSHSNERIQAFLLIPRHIAKKAPGILAIHQDGNTRPYRYGKSEVAGLAGDPDLPYGLELCLRGYVVICPDRFPHESRSLANSSFKALFDKFRIFLRTETQEIELTEDLYQGCIGNRLLLQGWTPLGAELYELQCAIDCLCGLAEVDSERIGVIGHSAGGLFAAYLMYIDSRIKVGCTSCGTWLSRKSINANTLRPINGFGGVTPGLQQWGDLDDVLAGLAPRPYFECRGDAAPAETEELIQKATSRYAELGVAGHFKFIDYEGGHIFRKDMREQAYEWFDRWLR